MGESLYEFWERFGSCFKTRTRDTSERAYEYLRGQLTMDTKRNFVNMDRKLSGGEGQPLHHIISCSSRVYSTTLAGVAWMERSEIQEWVFSFPGQEGEWP